MNSPTYESFINIDKNESYNSLPKVDFSISSDKKEYGLEELDSKLPVFIDSPSCETQTTLSGSPAKEEPGKFEESPKDECCSIDLEKDLFAGLDSDDDEGLEDVHFRRKKLHIAEKEAQEEEEKVKRAPKVNPFINDFSVDENFSSEKVTGNTNILCANVKREVKNSKSFYGNREHVAPLQYPSHCPPHLFYNSPYFMGNPKSHLRPEAPPRVENKENSMIIRDNSTKSEVSDDRKRKNPIFEQVQTDREDTVYISNLPRSFINIDSLNKIFKKFGSIVNIQTNFKEASAIIQYNTPEEASKACRVINKLKVSLFSSDKIKILSKSNTVSSQIDNDLPLPRPRIFLSHEKILTQLTDKIRQLLEAKIPDRNKLESEIKGIKSLMSRIRAGYELETLEPDLKKHNIKISYAS